MSRKIEKILLFLACRRQFRKIVRIDDDVTGRAGHDSFARALERFARSPGNVEKPLPRCRFDLQIKTAVGPKKTHKGHAPSFSCSTAALAIR